MKLKIVIEKTSSGYSGYVPSLPGIAVAGETRVAVRKLLREAAAISISEKLSHGLDQARKGKFAIPPNLNHDQALADKLAD